MLALREEKSIWKWEKWRQNPKRPGRQNGLCLGWAIRTLDCGCHTSLNHSQHHKSYMVTQCPHVSRVLGMYTHTHSSYIHRQENRRDGLGFELGGFMAICPDLRAGWTPVTSGLGTQNACPPAIPQPPSWRLCLHVCLCNCVSCICVWTPGGLCVPASVFPCLCISVSLPAYPSLSAPWATEEETWLLG